MYTVHDLASNFNDSTQFFYIKCNQNLVVNEGQIRNRIRKPMQLLITLSVPIRIRNTEKKQMARLMKRRYNTCRGKPTGAGRDASACTRFRSQTCCPPAACDRRTTPANKQYFRNKSNTKYLTFLIRTSDSVPLQFIWCYFFSATAFRMRNQTTCERE